MKRLSKKKELKNKIFRRGVEAINTLTGKNENYYYCPICAQPFSKDALDVNELTLGHIPPEAQKGKGLALTCRLNAGRIVHHCSLYFCSLPEGRTCLSAAG